MYFPFLSYSMIGRKQAEQRYFFCFPLFTFTLCLQGRRRKETVGNILIILFLCFPFSFFSVLFFLLCITFLRFVWFLFLRFLFPITLRKMLLFYMRTSPALFMILQVTSRPFLYLCILLSYRSVFSACDNVAASLFLPFLVHPGRQLKGMNKID